MPLHRGGGAGPGERRVRVGDDGRVAEVERGRGAAAVGPRARRLAARRIRERRHLRCRAWPPASAPPPAAAAPEGINPKAPCPCGSGRRYKHCHGSGYAPAGDPALRGPARRGRLGGAARAGAVGHGDAADDGRPRRDPRQRAARRHPGAGPRQRRDPARRPDADVLGRRQPRHRDGAGGRAGGARGRPGRPGPIGAAGSAGPRLQELLDLDRAVRGRRPRRLRVLAGGHRPRRRRRWPGWSTPTRRSCRPCGWPASRPPTGCGRATSAPTCAGCGPEPEEKLLDALARLSASEQILLGEGTRYAGAFRALGLVVPVWDLPADTPAEDWVEPGDGVPDPARAGPRGDRAAHLRRAPGPGRTALPADHAPLSERPRGVSARRVSVRIDRMSRGLRDRDNERATRG